MKVPIALTTTAAVCLALVAASTDEAFARSSSASETFWMCPSGFAFEVSGKAVHCKKAAYTERKVVAACPLGLYAMVDRIGQKDMCAATNPVSGEVSVERGCKSTDVILGFTKRIVSGADFCGKDVPAQIVAPNVAVVITG